MDVYHRTLDRNWVRDCMESQAQWLTPGLFCYFGSSVCRDLCLGLLYTMMLQAEGLQAATV